MVVQVMVMTIKCRADHDPWPCGPANAVAVASARKFEVIAAWTLDGWTATVVVKGGVGPAGRARAWLAESEGRALVLGSLLSLAECDTEAPHTIERLAAVAARP